MDTRNRPSERYYVKDFKPSIQLGTMDLARGRDSSASARRQSRGRKECHLCLEKIPGKRFATHLDACRVLEKARRPAA